MKDKLRRAGWLFLVILFLVTGLGVGVVAFWQSTHQKKDTSSVSPTNNPPAQQLKGTQLTGFTPIAHIDTLQAVDMQMGTGAEAKSDSTVTVHYTGAVAATGIIFESSLDAGKPVSFSLAGNLIQGWKKGVPGMKVNGQRRLLIPAAMAYGSSSPSVDIPANADLVFDITLLDTK